MNNLKIYLFSLALLLCFLNYSPARAQSIPQNFSGVNVDDLSDAQIRQYLDQARASGLTDDQLLQSAKSRGMSDAQVQRLQARIADVKSQGSSSADTTGKPSRILNNQTDALANSTQKRELSNRVFGADLFRNAGGGNSFISNLKLATPVNYILGPDDQLRISVYGKSLANWNLDVSPEGNINIPGIGIVKVAGKTIEQATALIKSTLAANRYAIGNGTNVQVDLGNIRTIQVIVQGQVVRPGTYSMSSLSSVFAALSIAGGPNDIGSFRRVEVIRNNQIIRHVDLYDFLVKGSQKDNITLKDQDIVRVPTYQTHVELSGEVKIPAIFEPLPGETLADVIRFAGDFTDQAYRDLIRVTQISGQQRKIVNITASNYNTYMPKPGDKYVVDRILERFENRVTITGAVFRPGEYELQNGLTLSQLINNAAGLREDAFTPRGTIIRLKPDNTTEAIPFSVAGIINKTDPDIALQREDNVYISSIFDLRDNYTVNINGEVRNSGNYPYAENLTIEDLIIKAGGLAEGASSKRVEVSRRVNNSDPTSKASLVAQVFTVNIDPDLKPGALNFKLQPFDIVSVYGLPGYEKQRIVNVTGEVLYPGPYTIQNKNEKISDILKRAGGLTASADPEGGTLKRNNLAILGADGRKIDTTELNRDRIKRLSQLKRISKDSTSITTDMEVRNNYVGINLKEILAKPGSKTDLIAEDGDEIRVPKKQEIVKLNGEVLYPSSVVYSSGKGLRGYVSNAGGFSSTALRRSVYVVYPNGTVEATHKFLFFNIYPHVRPGSEIFVPKKIEKPRLSTQELLGITTGLASLGAIILGIISLNNK